MNNILVGKISRKSQENFKKISKNLRKIFKVLVLRRQNELSGPLQHCNNVITITMSTESSDDSEASSEGLFECSDMTIVFNTYDPRFRDWEGRYSK